MVAPTTEPSGSPPDDDPPGVASHDDGGWARQPSDSSPWGSWQRDYYDQYSSGWDSWEDQHWSSGDRWSWQPWGYYNNYRSAWRHPGSWGDYDSWNQHSSSGDPEQSAQREQDENSEDPPASSDPSNPDESSQDVRRPSTATQESTDATRTPLRQSRDSGSVTSETSGKADSKGSFSEKMAVPTFGATGSGDELGVSARSYLRQIEAWSKVTRTAPAQQALLLYQHLSGRAWVESEELSVEDLASERGLQIFKSWIRERYQEVEVSRIAEALTLFFKKMKRQNGQSIREFNSVFDRSHSRLLEIDCKLPEVARAWAYLNALGLSNTEELSLLASVGNDYSTAKLQKAAILHEKSLRGPWVPKPQGEGKGTRSAFYTGVDDEEGLKGIEEEDSSETYISEEVAVELHEAFVAQESAKARYRDVVKARGIDPETLKKKSGDEVTRQQIDDRLAQAELRSYCAGCGRRGHWHKDPERPLNKNGNPASKPKTAQDHQVHATSVSPDVPASIVEVAYMVGDLGGDRLPAITDTACSKSVMGQGWLESYVRLAKEVGVEVQFLDCHDDFRFGASKLFHASFSATIMIQIRNRVFMLKASVAQGEVPLLMSRSALSKLGMVYDLEDHSAQFKKLGIDKYMLLTTDSGHPAIPVSPKRVPGLKWPTPQQWAGSEVIIVPPAESQYMSYMVSAVEGDASVPVDPIPRCEPLSKNPDPTPGLNLFHPKKINDCVRNLLCAEPLNVQSFATWILRSDQVDYLTIDYEGPSSLEPLLGPRFSVVPRLSQLQKFQMSSSSAPVNVWKMTKTELMAEAMRLNLTIHATWSVGEIRQVITDHKRESEGSSVPKGLASMTLDQLKAQAVEYQIEMPTKPTKGQLQMLIRDAATRNKAEALVTFGRHRGKLFKEVPSQYLDWAMKEVKARGVENSGPDLVSLANYARSLLEPEETITYNPEIDARVPLPSEDGSSWETHWSELTETAKTMNAGMGYGTKVMAGPTEQPPKAAPMKRTTDETAKGQKPMEQEIPSEDELEEEVPLDQFEEPGETFTANFSPRETRVEADSLEIFYEAREDIPGADTIGNSVEHFAKDRLAQKDFTFSTCEKIVRAVCQRAQSLRRRKINQGTDSIALGGYSHGNHYGIIQKTYAFHQTTKYINALMKTHGAHGHWSTFQLRHNCHVGPDKDAHNLSGTRCWTIAFGDYNGGRLWLQSDPNAKVDGASDFQNVKLSDGTEAIGEVVNTCEHMTDFSPKTRHAVEEWEGDRCSIVAYTTRGVHHLSRTERDVLRTFGFPLGRHEGSSPCDRESFKRPKKSIRKSLWKGAQRASAFPTLGLAAASSFLSEYMPSGKAVEQACVFEIGGTNITYQMTEAGAHVVEPISWEEYLDSDLKFDVHHTIQTLKPNVVWFQGESEFIQRGERVLQTIDYQLGCGGSVVLQGLFYDPIWNSRALSDLLGQHPHSCEEHGELRTLRLGRLPAQPDQGDDSVHEGVREGFVASHNRRNNIDHEGASAIHFDGDVPKHVQSALTRLHQNLGHPRIVDMLRHLRYAGADEGVLKACKKMRCEACARNQATQVARPATLPSLLDMNQLVSVDVFHAFDANRVRHEFLSVIDHATTFHLVCELEGHSTEAFCRSFTQLWGNTFGAPGTISADLETGLQGGITKSAEFFGSNLRSSAGQAHWQQGVVERHGLWYQEILRRVIDEKSITSEDMYLAVQAVNSAKNELRRRHGFSPTQAVFGRDPRSPEEICGANDEDRYIEVLSADRRRQREVSIRTAAKMAFFRTQADSKFRKALVQRSRIKRGGYAVGELVSFYRIEKVATKRGSWRGPGTIIGSEGGNWWVSFGGRCHLVAEEHLRPIMNPLRCVEHDGDDPGQELRPAPDEEMVEDMDFALELEGGELFPELFGDEGQTEPSMPGPVRRRVRNKAPEPYVHTAHMMKRCQTDRALEKALEKEIPWKLIPESEHEAFRQAEDKQFQEHLDHSALKPIGVEESEEIIAKIDPSRILNSPRLVVSGHHDPDVKHLETDAPTINRLTILTLLQVLACRRKSDDWEASAGDITAACLNGDDMDRELYLRQPRTGLRGLDPRQLLKITKGVFGLPDSPRKWWKRLRRDMLNIRIQVDGEECFFEQSPLDPCLFQLVSALDKKPKVYVGVHVDDLLVLPVDDWEIDSFDYIGSHIRVSADGVHVDQEAYASSRLFEIKIEKGQADLDPATEEQRIDNQSLIGALSWLSSQSRTDLQCSVSLAQQCQKYPTVEDIKFTNKIAKRAWEHRQKGIWLRPLDLESLEFLVYHDSAWANALLEGEDGFILSPEDHSAGIMTHGPFQHKDRKAKRANSRVASQMGILIVLTDKSQVDQGGGVASVLDWKSSANPRVCRSTFGAETTACSEAVELGQYVRSFMMTILSGELKRVEQLDGAQLRCITDCKSLFDHLHREGIPRIPSDKRLAIDLAALRQTFSLERIGERIPLFWVPTGYQLADVLTKPMSSDDW
ncbi:GIP [Symbiodinium sp. CCMP2592]|nr:GIP [Symbiodinium sp. CCMP2592]